MNEEDPITPFELGVLAAMTLLGKALATNPDLDLEKFRGTAQKVMDSLPQGPKWKGMDRPIPQAAIEALLAGTEKNQKQ